MPVIIPVGKEHFAIVDFDDFETVSMFRWSLAAYNKQNIYAQTHVRKENGTRTTLKMHQLIMGGSFIDHINGNGLDNRRENLRFSDYQTNQQNSRKRINTTSKYKGVVWHTRDKVWSVGIWVNNKRQHLGSFDNEIEAAHVYDKAAIRLFGEFANLNFPI